MQGSVVDPLSSYHHDVAAEKHLARFPEQRWPVGSAILFTAGLSALLWAAILFGIRAIL